MALDINYLARDTDLTDDFRRAKKSSTRSSLTEQAQRLEVKLVSRESHRSFRAGDRSLRCTHHATGSFRKPTTTTNKSPLTTRLPVCRSDCVDYANVPKAVAVVRRFKKSPKTFPVPSDVSLVEEVLNKGSEAKNKQHKNV